MRSRPALALMLFLAAACGKRPPFLGGPSCPHDLALERTASWSVIVSSYPEVVRHDLSMEQVSRLPGIENLGPGGKLQGLTLVRHQLGYNTGISLTRPFLGGQSCAWIESLTVDLAPDKIEIFVPSEYPEDGCEYEQILEHERQHEDTDRDALAQAAVDMRGALAKADYLPARGTPLAVAGRSEAQKRVEAMVDKAAKPVYDEFLKTLGERQAVIDLPENYRWVAQRCSHWK